jgi:hypothetical protein
MEKHAEHHLIFSLCWGIGGGMALKDREEFCIALVDIVGTTVELPGGLDHETTLLDYEVDYKCSSNQM